MSLGERIKAKRIADGLSQETLAARLRTSQTNLSRWECGECDPSLRNMRSIAYFLETTPGALVDEAAADAFCMAQGTLVDGGTTRDVNRDITGDAGLREQVAALLLGTDTGREVVCLKLANKIFDLIKAKETLP